MKKITLNWRISKTSRIVAMYCFKRCDVNNN